MKKEKGITLVALIVTIIILLILVGVTISQISGNNGLFSKVRQAVDKYQKSQEMEKLEIDKFYTQLASLGETNGMTEEEIKSIIEKIVESKIGDINTNLLDKYAELERKIAQQETEITNLKNNGISPVKLEIIPLLTSPTQLTHAGFYAATQMDENVNADAKNKFDDYGIGDFQFLLLTSIVSADNGCRFGTLIITSPRFENKFWVATIWDYKFVNFYKITPN